MNEATTLAVENISLSSIESMLTHGIPTKLTMNEASMFGLIKPLANWSRFDSIIFLFPLCFTRLHIQITNLVFFQPSDNEDFQGLVKRAHAA